MKMITDLQDDVVTPNVMQLGDGPLTDIEVEPGSVLSDRWAKQSDAITMHAQSAERERKMQQLVDVAYAKAGDKAAAKRVESDALLRWALTAEAAADAENTEDVLGTQLARHYGTGDPGAVWDAMNASADYEYEQMPVWYTRAEGMRLVWGRFRKMVQGKKAAADAAQAAVNERRKGLKAFVDGKDAKRDAGGKLADDAITDGRLWEFVNQGVLELADVQRAQKVREFMRRYVRPLGKRAEMDERMRGLDGLRDEVYELIGEDKDTARLFYESLMRWAGEQRGKNDTGAGDEFQVAVGKKLSDWARAVDEVAPLALLAVGAPGPVAPALVKQAVGTYEARRDKNERQRLSSGILRAGIDEAMKEPEGGFWQSVKNAPRVAAAMAGDTLPYLVPVVGVGLGTADAFVRGFTSGIDAKVLDAELGGNQGGWESRKAMGNAAMVESGIQALVELMPWSRVGGKGLAASVGRKMKAVTGGKYVPGALSRALARGTQKSVTRALVAEFGANVVTEGVLEPIAQGALTLTAEVVMDLAGVEHGRSKSFSEAFAELGEIWEPEQLAGFLMFSAALTAPAYGQARKNVQLYQANVKKFAKNAEVWETQGLSRAEAEEAAGAENPQERGNQLVAEGWKNDAAGMHARLVQKHKELKDSGRTLVFAGVQGKSGFDADTVKLLGEAWRASKDKYHLPDVELLGDGRVRLTRAEIPGVVEGIDLTLTEEQADAFLFQELNRLDVERMRDWQKSGGNVEEYEGLQTKLAGLVDVAMGDVAVDAAVAEGSMDVEEMGKGLPEELRGLIKQAGGMNLGVAKKISEWAIGQMEALEAGGMSRAEAREQVASADGGATLGVLAGMGASMQKRLEAAGDMRLRSALNRRRGGRRVAFNGRSVLGSVLVHARGGATGMNAVEDISESVFDMMVQGRTEAILENQAAARKAAGEAERPATLTEVRAAEEQAWKELAEVARKAREALLKVDPDFAIEEVNGDRLNTIEALSSMALSRYLGSGVLPRWMSGLVDVMRKNVQAAAAVVQLQKAMVALGEQDAGALKDLLEFLDDAGVQVGKSLAGARVEAVADRIRELARWHAGADAAGPGGVGGMSVSQAQEEVLEEEDEIQQNDKAREAVAAAKPADAAKREDAEDKRMFEPEAGRGAVPERMRGVFVGDAAVYNAAGDFWCGQVEKNKLSDGTEQVKVGEKGKHGVIAGKELTGRFVNDTAPILVWKRRDGSLQVISGRHRFAKLMEDESATGVMCYVYEESEERDERWARMKDYEQNMRDDQADEVTCAVYARETGLTEAEMRERGLTRNGSRSKRGIFIGQHAREELWTRFRNGEIKPIDAELVCKLTAALADQSQVAEIQAHCCGLLKAGKSWDYIGASVQLMASSQAQQAEQMLLDLGADFTADLERMARWVELCRKAFREAIDLLKDEKRRVKKGAKASRLGLSATMTEEKREEMLGDLEAMDAKFEMIGSYPELVAEAKMWDGDESKFADPVAMYLERVEAMQDEGLQEEQARREAEEATPTFSWSLTQADIIGDLEKSGKYDAFYHAVDSLQQGGKPTSNQSDTPVLYAAVSERLRDEVSRLSNGEVDLSDGSHSVNVSDLWHSYREHCLDFFMEKNQLNLTHDDLRMIPDIVENYDSVKISSHNKGVSLEYTKRYGDIEFFVVETVTSKRQNPRGTKQKTIFLSDITKKANDGSFHPTPSSKGFIRTEIVNPISAYIKQNYAAEARKIAKKAIRAKRGLIAPNGRPSNLSPELWLAVRLQSFKGWFGDWERAADLSFDGSEYNNETCLKMLAEEAGTPFVNDETGIEAEINNRQRGKITSGKAQRKSGESGFSTGVHNFVAAHIRRLFKHAVHVGDYRDKNQSDDVLAIKRFVCPVRIKGVEAFAYMTVKELKQHGHKIYTLELDTIERLGGNLDEHFEEMLNPAPSKGILARVNELRKTYFENVSKVVDENGEPLVVYHGTVHGGFRVFDVDGRGKTEGSGAFFTSDKRVAEGYSANFHTGGVKPEVYACFLNIREPHEVDFEGNSWNKVPGRAAGYFVHYDNGESEWFGNKADADFAVSGYEGKAEIEEDWEESPTLDDLAREVWEEEPEADGIIARNVVDTAVGASKAYPATDYIVASPTQIKSATDNRGTFDGNNPDITYSVTGGKNLAAVHSLNAEKFLAAEEATGMFSWSSSLTPAGARSMWRKRLDGKEVQRVVDFKGVSVDLAVSSHLGEKGGDALRRVVAGDYRADMERWKQQALAVLQGMVGKKKWNDVEQHVRAGKATMDVVKRAIAEGKIAPLPKQGGSDEELRALHHKRIVYFEKRKGEVLDLLEGVMSVRSVDESKLSSSVYFHTPYGKVRLSDHAEPMGTGHAVSTVLDLRYDMSDAEVMAAVESYMAETGGRGAALAGLVDNPAVSFSVIGRNAKTWGKYTDRAFVGRDDGMWRAEIDASGAKLKWEDLRGKNVSAYRKLVAGWDNLPEAERKQVESYAEQVYDWQEESEKLNSTPESEFLEQYNKVIKLRDALKPKREEIRSLLNKMFVKHGGSAAAVLNMEDAELDELACSLWGPYVEDKVEKMLDLRPLWNGGMKLADVMEYPELYEAYPELADITVRYATMENANGRALYQDGEHEILINRNLEGEWRGILSILLHEIQHHIQNIEGFAKGGNPSYARRLVDNRAARGDADAMSLRELSDMELYHRIAGEIEARNVQRRWDWSAEKRAAIPFNSTLEYPGEALVTFSVQRKRDLTLDGERVTQKQAWEHLAALEGKPLRNARSQFVAVVNKPQRKELTNIGKAWKSSNNGFSVGAHYAAVGRIEKLFLHAVPCGVYPDSKNGKSDVKILRFACPIMLGGEKAVAWMTAKKSEDKKGSERLYNLELVDIEKLAGKLESVQQSAARFTTDKVTPPPASQKLAGTLENLASHRLQDDLPSASRDIVAEVEDAFKTYFEDEPEAGNNFSASLTGAAAAGRRVLEESGDEYVANRLQEAWQKNLEKWSVLHAGRADANSAMRAVMEMEGLVKATYDVVQDDVKLGRLYMLQRWAMVYARMVESGEIPPKGALKGQAYEKFVERLAEQQRTERRRGMSREQAEELVKELGVTRLEGAMEKVARECMRAAEWHLKQKETARVKRLLEAAWPKREEGKKSPRGKLAAREYRRLEWIAKVMEFSGEDKYKETQRIIREIDELPQELVGYEERVAELEGKLAALDPKQADYVERKAELDKAMRELNPNEVGYDEAKAELEDQLNWLHVFGGWAEMDVSQARKAARALEDLLLRGYTEWELKVQRERERTRRVADEISAHFKAPWYATRMERKQDADAMGTNKPKMVKGLRWGLMGYAQMMLALRKKLGKVFCDRQRRTLAEAHRNLLQAQKDLQDWSAMELQKITGLTGAALEQWIASNNQNVNTGILMQQVRSERIRMNAKEVDRLGAMSEKEYEAWRDGELAKAEADGRAVVLPTAEELLVLRGLRLERPGRKWLEVARTEQQAVELVATKEAMLYAVLLFEQPDYEHLVEAHGLSWADVDTMKKLIGPKLLRWGYAMRRHLNENGELLAAKYEAWNGTPFGRRANYFRGVFDVNKLKPETDIIDGNAGANSLGGSKYSILIPRRYHRQQINWQVGASQVFMLTMNEQNNYIHTQHITREWRQLLSRKGFADGLSAEIGANAVNMIKLHLDVIDAAPRADAAMTSLFGRLVQGVMKATAISSLALNVYSYMKQVSCLLNAIVGGYVPDAAVKQSGVYQVLTYSGIGAGELVRSYARVLSGRGAVSFKEMTGSAVIQSRIQSGGRRVADALMMRTGQAMPNAAGRAGEVAGEWALEQMDMIDRRANTVAAMVVADAVYRKLAATEGGKEAGDKWVRAQAVEAAGLMVDLVAQPKLRTQKGLWASHGGFFGGVGNFFYMFRSESLAKIGTYLAQVSSGDYAKALGGFMSMGVGLWLVGLLCSFLKGQIDGDDLDEEEDLLKFARKSVTEVIFGDLASLPIVGGGIGAAKAAVGGTWHYVNDPLQMILPVSDLWKRPKQLYKAVDNDGIWSFKAMRALCNCLRAGGNASGWGMGTGSAVTSSAAGIILGAAVLGNAGRFVLDVAERVTEE